MLNIWLIMQNNSVEMDKIIYLKPERTCSLIETVSDMTGSIRLWWIKHLDTNEQSKKLSVDAQLIQQLSSVRDEHRWSRLNCSVRLFLTECEMIIHALVSSYIDSSNNHFTYSLGTSWPVSRQNSLHLLLSVYSDCWYILARIVQFPVLLFRSKAV